MGRAAQGKRGGWKGGRRGTPINTHHPTHPPLLLSQSINGIINKVNADNVKYILPELFGENLVRGRGLLCRALLKQQLASPTYAPVLAAVAAVVNTKFPEIGELLLGRCIATFKRAYGRNDKAASGAAAALIAHLANQGVADPLLPLQLLTLLLEAPTADSVELAVGLARECGARLAEAAPRAEALVFDRFRAVLADGAVDRRAQFLMEALFRVRRDGYIAHPALPAGLDLIDDDDQITHAASLDDAPDPAPALDDFAVDPAYAAHEAEYDAIRKEILGDGSEEEEESGDDDDEDNGDAAPPPTTHAPGGPIKDATETNLVNLRRTIYLTLMSALDFEEAGHKLSKIALAPGQEIEVVTMIIECCSQEKTYLKFYGMLAQRFCALKPVWADLFEQCFQKQVSGEERGVFCFSSHARTHPRTHAHAPAFPSTQYALIHRLETNKLRNVARLYGHLFATDALSWATLACVRLTEDDTTSSSRIFVKVLFQDLAEAMGLASLLARVTDPSLAGPLAGLFPDDSARNLRFAINFFTSCGLGALTEGARAHLKELPALLAARRAAAPLPPSSSGTLSSSSSYTSSGSSSYTSSSGTSRSRSRSRSSTPRSGRSRDDGDGGDRGRGPRGDDDRGRRRRRSPESGERGQSPPRARRRTQSPVKE